MLIFGINLPLRGSIEKLVYRCTTVTRNLTVYNSTIIVLKITPLNSVSVITKFVIRKRNKNKKKTKTEKNHTFSSAAGARPTIPTILGMVIDEVRTIFAPRPNVFDPISSFAATGY